MFNKSQIMKEAWAIVRKANVEKFGFRVIMARALKAAWANARHAIAMAAHAVRNAMMTAKKKALKNEIAVLESKTRWDRDDYAKHTRLQQAYVEAV